MRPVCAAKAERASVGAVLVRGKVGQTPGSAVLVISDSAVCAAGGNGGRANSLMSNRLGRCLGAAALRAALVLDDEAVVTHCMGMGKIEIALVLRETGTRASAMGHRRIVPVQQADRGRSRQNEHAELEEAFFPANAIVETLAQPRPLSRASG